MPSTTVPLVAAALGTSRLGFPLHQVTRVVRAAEVTPLPNAPGVVLGVLDVAGAIVPVVSARRRFGMPDLPVGPDAQFVLLNCAGRPLAVVVDTVEGLLDCAAADIAACDAGAMRNAHLEGVVRLGDGLVLITDADRFFLHSEALALTAALAEAA